MVGSNVGLGVGMVEGMMLGETVGMTDGAGVVGEGVITFDGFGVGAGVGIQVEHSSVRVETPPDEVNLFLYTLHTYSPIGGL